MTLLATRVAYSDTASGSNTVLTIPGPVGFGVGAVLTAFVASSGGGSTIGLTDSKGNTWTQRQYASNANSPSAVVAIFTCTVTTALVLGDTLTGTSTAGTGCGDIMLTQITSSSNGLITYSGGSTGTGNSNAPAVTAFTPASGDLVLAALVESSNTLQSSSTAGAGFTKLPGIDTPSRSRAVVGQFAILGASATTTPFAMAVSQQYAIAAVRFTETAPPSASLRAEMARFSYGPSTSVTSRTVPVTSAVSVGDFVVLSVNVPAGGGTNTTCTVTDTKSNTWTLRQKAVNGPGNAQPMIVTATITTALTTSDTLSVTVNFGSTIWEVLGLAFIGVTAYDKGIANNGASSSSLDTTATAAGAQDSQLLVAAFAGGGTGITMTGITPGGMTAVTPITTATTIRNLWVIWGFVNNTGTRQVTASMSDSASHAWAGALAVMNANPPAVSHTAFVYISGAWVACDRLLWDSGTSTWMGP